MTNKGYLSDETVRSLAVFEEQLFTVDSIMKELAKSRGFKLVGNFHGEWPARGIRKRHWVTYYDISICLNPDYLDEGKAYYLLVLSHFVWVEVSV
ncbi:MAG: hypothetical protein HZA22_12315 [Nitrospirae bacterium]|nr:hypothetical protein [Nitrospirota bacterium]